MINDLLKKLDEYKTKADALVAQAESVAKAMGAKDEQIAQLKGALAAADGYIEKLQKALSAANVEAPAADPLTGEAAAPTVTSDAQPTPAVTA